MIKFTLTKSERDRAFVASGEHFRGAVCERHTIVGHWSPHLRGRKTPVKLQIAYDTAFHSIVVLRGVYDPEENSLRGTTTTLATNLEGEFVFKRDPDFVRFYPAPSVANVRELWNFALTSVLDRVRRQAWSSSHILKRAKDGRRLVELGVRICCGRDLTEDEAEELLTLLPGLYEADTRFYASLIRINMNKIPTFP